MSADARIAALLGIAAADVGAAEMPGATLPGHAAFHLQQAAEKLTRAFLLRAGIEGGITHDIEALASRLPTGHGWRERLLALRKHSPSATKYRYPTISGRVPTPPSPQEITADVEAIRSLIAAATEELGVGSGKSG